MNAQAGILAARRLSGAPGSRPGSVLRCLVVDDHLAIRVGLRELLAAESDFEVLDALATAESAVAFAERTRLDVAVVDYQLGAHSGLWVSRKLKRLPHPPAVAPDAVSATREAIDDRLQRRRRRRDARRRLAAPLNWPPQ